MEDVIWNFGEQSKRNLICYTAESIRHPAKMHLQMCREIIKRYSKPGDLILDPMAGVGTTIVEGMILGRNIVGVEYEQKFADIAQKNIVLTEKAMKFMKVLGIGRIIKGDSRELSKLLDRVYGNLKREPGNIEGLQYVDSIMTSPPYGHESYYDRPLEASPSPFVARMRKTHKTGQFASDIYSDDPANLGNLKGETYLEAMFIIYKECFKVLKAGGYMILVTKNFSRNKKEIRLDLDTIKLCESVGFTHTPSDCKDFPARHRRFIRNPSFWIKNHWAKHPDAVKIQYEDVLVFQKPQVKA
jgi:modification methylase